MSYDGTLSPIDYVTAGGTTYYVKDGPTNRSDPTTYPATIPCPSAYSWKLSDISASDAGRTEDGKMHKKRLTGTAGQKRHLELEWVNIYRAQASAIMVPFNSEYFTIRYWDVLDNAYKTGTFYSGDRESPMYNMALGIQSSVKFNIIEQ